MVTYITDHFSAPGNAVGQVCVGLCVCLCVCVCVCEDNNVITFEPDDL